MKRAIFTLLLAVCFTAGYSQLYNNGGTITVETGATLVVEGDYTSTSNGLVDIDGTVELKGDLINTSGGIESSSTGILKFNGTAGAQEITGATSTTFYCAVEVNNAAGVALTNTSTGSPAVLDSTLTLTSGTVTLNQFDLTMSGLGIAGADASKYVVTNGTGRLKGTVAASNVTFPVGNAAYNPVVLNNAGTSDTYGVIANETMPTNWTTANHAVAVTWTVTETGGGGDLTVTPQWNTAQQQASFDNTDCAVGLTTDNGSTFTWGASSAAAGTNPYTQSASNFTDVGQFVVGDYFHEGIDLDLDLFLAGPYSAGNMTLNLNTKGLIPLTDPYSLGVTVSTIPATAVDWIKVELRDKTNSANILHTKAFFLDNTGNVISPDGSSTAKFAGVAKDQYYVAVKHRNHLGAMTNSTVDLAAVSPAFNFKSGAGVYQNQSYTPMFNLGGGNYGLYKGNVNNDAKVAKVGLPSQNDYSALLSFLGANTSILNVYSGADVTMDGDVRKVGLTGVNDYSQLLNSLGSSTSLNQQVP